MLLGPLKHHVFQHMRNAGDAIVFVAGADLIPDLRDNHRGPMILLHQDLKTII